MTQPESPQPATPGEISHAREFLSTILHTYEAYHNHKESMAYAGFTLYGALFGAAVLTPKWPDWNEVATIAAASATWLFFLLYLGWQLRLRRLASIRVAGLERLLADWITDPPTKADLQRQRPAVPRPLGRRERVRRAVSVMWPLRSGRADSDLPDDVYPAALVRAWTEQRAGRGTDAMFHERLIFIAGWLLFGLVLTRAIGVWSVAA